jgi:hypothetical protein
MNNIIQTVLRTGIRKYIPLLLAPLFFIGLIVACDDMNDIHQKYYDRGEDIYTGVVDSLKFSAGYERIQFDWEVNADPRITRTVIFWNRRRDSVVINVNRTQSGAIPMTHTLEIAEGNYVFEFITRDNEGHYSVGTELSVQIYGPDYARFLRNRDVTSVGWQPDGTVLIKWGSIASREIQYANVEYTVNGQQQTTRVPNDENETVIEGVGSGDVLAVYTTYLPLGGLDHMNSPQREYILPVFEVEQNKANFRAVVLPGDNTSVNGSRPLQNIWDGAVGNPGILHTVENAAGFGFPHFFTFDMGRASNLSRFRIWPRTDSGAFTGHSPRFFEIWGTAALRNQDDESYWTSDAWRADWTLLGDHEIIKPEGAAEQRAAWTGGWEYPVREDAGAVRYIRLVIKSPNWQNSNCVNIGEITLWGD